MILQERLQDAFQQFGWSRIPEILHTHAEEAAKHNISYLEFLDKLLQDVKINVKILKKIS